MTDQKPNCGNCPKFSYIERDVNSGKLCRACGCPQDQVLKLPACDGEVEQYNQMVTKKHGCLDHPSAREWLMREVIAELERLITQPTLDNDIKVGLEHAIAVIRGEK